MTESASIHGGGPVVSPPAGDTPRRGFLYQAVTAVMGAFLGIFPVISGVLFFLDPLRKRNAGGGDSASKEGFIKIGKADSVPADGTPVRFVVIIPRRQDAWTTYLNEPVGAVYVRKNQAGSLEVFNVTCPHLGCAVDYLPSTKQYLCPCHDSAFSVDGKRTNQTPPRDLDSLELDPDKLKEGELWVKYQDFKSGEEHKVPKV